MSCMLVCGGPSVVLICSLHLGRDPTGGLQADGQVNRCKQDKGRMHARIQAPSSLPFPFSIIVAPGMAENCQLIKVPDFLYTRRERFRR